MDNYQDRGMQKWAGFYLAEHSKRIEETAKQETATDREEQSEEEVSCKLFELWKQKNLGNFQLNQLTNNQYQEIIGYVSGFSEDEIILTTTSEEVQSVARSSIRNVEKMDHKKWFKEGVPFES